MLFSYPVEATAENWLHEILFSILHEAMEQIDNGAPVIGWPDCIPLERRDRLRRYKQLGVKLEALLESYRGLSALGRQLVREAAVDQAAFVELFDGQRAALRMVDLPEIIRHPARQFFDKAFDMLTSIGIRDNNYKIFLSAIEHRVCAFCGCEYFSGAGSRREPLDHYLPISIYPFAGANARNLVPMGSRCNSSYKLSQDMLRRSDGERRRCFDPYSTPIVAISLRGTRLFARNDGLPEWHVEIQGDLDCVRTWDDVFDIRQRYIIDHLDPIYRNTFKVFAIMWGKLQVELGESARISDAFLHLRDLSIAEGWSDRAFLKAALYDLLHVRCGLGGAEGERIIAEYADASRTLG